MGLAEIEAASTRTRVGPRTTRVIIDGYERVNEHPFVLAGAANLDRNSHQPDLYALARMVHAEEGSSSVIEKFCVAEAVVNRARSRKSSPYNIITWDQRKELWGWFGEQSGRFCASGGGSFSHPEDPNEQDAECAIQAFNRELTMVRGAEKFFAPHIRTQRGKRIKTRETIVTEWAIEGYQWVGEIDGLDAGKLHLLANKGRGNANPTASIKFFRERFGDEGPSGETVAAGASAIATLVSVAGKV